MVEALPIIAVVSSSAVALAAIGANVWQQRQGFGHDREMADRESVRGYLAKSAGVLYRAEEALRVAALTLTGHASSMLDPEYPERAKPRTRLGEVGQELDQAVGQLRIQLGPDSSVTAALENAAAVLRGAYHCLLRIRCPGPTTQGRAMVRIEDRNERETERVEAAQKDFEVAVTEYVRLAHAAAGARLPVAEDQPAAE